MARLVVGTDKTKTVPAIVVEKVLAHAIEKSVDANGVLQNGTNVINMSGVKDIGEKVLQYACYQNYDIVGTLDMSSVESITAERACYEAFGESGITGVNLSNLKHVSGRNACQYMFYKTTSLAVNNLNLGSLIDTSNGGCGSMFSNCTGLTGIVNLSSLETSGGCAGMFQSCTGITGVIISSLKTAGQAGCSNMFNGCTGITGVVDLSSLETVGNNGCNYMFNGCTGITGYKLDSLTTVEQAGLGYMFQNCTGITTGKFPSLKLMNAATVMTYAFSGCTNLTDIYFPALTNASFGSIKTQFNNMLKSVSGCRVHFPTGLNLQGFSGYPNFAGTGTSLVYDLPATNHLVGANSVEYERNPRYDTAYALAWRVADSNNTIDWTPYYTSGTFDPTTGGTIYSDETCTVVVTTISSIL